MEENTGRDEAVANENDNKEDAAKTDDPTFLERAKDFVVQHKGPIIAVGTAVAVGVGAVVAAAVANSPSDDDADDDDDYEPDDDYGSADDDQEPEYSGEWDDDDEDDGERLSAEDAALIYGSNGMDEDYAFGYDTDLLNDILHE